MPIYWKALRTVPPLEILCHRIAWSAVFTVGLIFARRRGSDLLQAFADRRLLRQMAASAALIGGNWLIFIYAVTSGHVLQSSLGYFINPLLSAGLGYAVLKERLGKRQRLALGLAAAGVAVAAVAATLGEPPWIALALASTFALYGLIRKTTRADALLGLCVETLLLAPAAALYLAWLAATDSGALFHVSQQMDLLLLGAGVVTALPLIWFAHAARRLDLSMLGILQYLSPTCQFLLAVALYDEPLSRPLLVSFALIWAALALFMTESAGRARRRA
jgi:chloramphenicol-sensitive protein RarD